MCMQHMHVEQNANRSLGNKANSTGMRTRIPIEIKLEALSSHSFQFEIPNPSGLRPDRRGARRIDDWRDG